MNKQIKSNKGNITEPSVDHFNDMIDKSCETAEVGINAAGAANWAGEQKQKQGKIASISNLNISPEIDMGVPVDVVDRDFPTDVIVNQDNAMEIN